MSEPRREGPVAASGCGAHDWQTCTCEGTACVPPGGAAAKDHELGRGVSRTDRDLADSRSARASSEIGTEALPGPVAPASREATAARDRVDHAWRVWQLADKARLEAADLRNRAKQLDKEAARLDTLAAGIQDGCSIEEALGV